MTAPHTVLVTGAAGFIGKDAVAHLLQQGWRVKAMVRRPEAAAVLPPGENLEVVYADMRDVEALRAALQGVNAVVHLAAAKSDEKDSDAINVGGARNLVASCRATGCSRIINISTQSAKLRRKGIYGRTKGQADAIFHDSGLAVTTLMPSLVYGDATSGVFGTVLKFVEKLPVVPVLGDGKWISAPIYVGDVSEAVIACLERDHTIGKRYDLGGPDQVSFDELIDRLAAARGQHRRKLHVPLGVALLAARLAVMVLPNPPITVSNVLGSNQDTDIDIGPARQDWDFNPMDLATGLKRVLGEQVEDERVLAAESLMVAHYLIDDDSAPELRLRYQTASRAWWGTTTDVELDFVRRHHWALPFIDAATGLLRPQSQVRKKVFLMAAILETSPTHAEFFLKKPAPLPRLLGRVVWNGTCSVLKVGMGIPLLWYVRRGR